MNQNGTALMTNLAEALQAAWRHHQVGDRRRAEQLYRDILRADPTCADAWCFLAALCHAEGRLAEAEEYLQRALQRVPHYQAAQQLLGIVLAQQGRLREAEAQFRDLLQRHPDDAEAHNNLANLLNTEGKAEEALIHCRRAVQTRPDFAEAHNNLGNALRKLGRLDEALPAFQEAVRLKPALVEAYLNLGFLFNSQGNLAQAEACYQSALRLRPSNKVRITLATLLPPLYQSVAEVHERRQRLIDNLRKLHENKVVVDLSRDEPTREVPTLFYLAYQGFNDRDIQRDYARLYRPVHPPVAPRERGSSKIRIGFLSRFLRDHTIGRLTRGLIAQLSRDLFDVTVLTVGHSEDPMARFIREHADHYLPLPHNPIAAAPLVARQQFDILFYPEVGMDSTTFVLANARLAPVQCVTWGHPVTTGLASMDYFVSSDLQEPDSAEEHYTEQLVRLRNLTPYYYRPILPAAAKPRAAFGLPADQHLYLCPQSLFKLHPEFDSFFQGILEADPRGQLVLLNIQQGGSQRLLEERFRRTMPREWDRVKILPRQTPDDYLQLLAAGDVMLDPLPFTGGNTTYEALAVGTPVVTLPGPFLRGRITYGCYRQMGLLDCVARDREDYIRLAARLGTAPDWRNEMRWRILARNHVLYENAAAVREMEQFFLDAVNKSR